MDKWRHEGETFAVRLISEMSRGASTIDRSSSLLRGHALQDPSKTHSKRVSFLEALINDATSNVVAIRPELEEVHSPNMELTSI